MVNGAFMVKRALPFNKRVRKTMEICAALRRDVATPTRGSCKSLQDYAGFKIDAFPLPLVSIVAGAARVREPAGNAEGLYQGVARAGD